MSRLLKRESFCRTDISLCPTEDNYWESLQILPFPQILSLQGQIVFYRAPPQPPSIWCSKPETKTSVPCSSDVLKLKKMKVAKYLPSYWCLKMTISKLLREQCTQK